MQNQNNQQKPTQQPHPINPQSDSTLPHSPNQNICEQDRQPPKLGASECNQNSMAKQDVRNNASDASKKEQMRNQEIIENQHINNKKSQMKLHQKVQQTVQQSKQEQNSKNESLKMQLLDMGFQQYLVKQAIRLTQDKDKAIQYIITSLQNQEMIQKNKPNSKPNSTKKVQAVHGKQQLQDKRMQKEEQEDFQDVQQQYKMIFLVRMDLKMGLGKIAAQVAHATLKAYKQMVERANYNDLDFVALQDWKELGQKKIVVKVDNQQQMMKTLKKASQKGLNNCYIRDAGLTQIASGSVTVGAIGPAPSSQIDLLTKQYKLL